MFKLLLALQIFTTPFVPGKYTLTAKHSTIADTAIARSIITSTVLPWVEESYAYTSYSEFSSFSNPLYEGTANGIGDLDQQFSVSSYDKSIKYTLLAGSDCSIKTFGRDIKLPTEEDEVWIEVWMKYSTGFTTATSYSCKYLYATSSYELAYKSWVVPIFAKVNRQSNFGGFTFQTHEWNEDCSTDCGLRINIGAPAGYDRAPGTYRAIAQPYYFTRLLGVNGPLTEWPSWPNDGQWHRVRLRFKTGGCNYYEADPPGTSEPFYRPPINSTEYELWLDNTHYPLYKQDSGGCPIYAISVGYSIIRDPQINQYIWFGNVRIWNTNPGW